jgi:hypothetical protein
MGGVRGVPVSGGRALGRPNITDDRADGPCGRIGVAMKRCCARICWNSYGWVFPSGEAKELEKGSYVTSTGFGHEEWLFNFAWLIDDYHYAFLQPVSNSFRKMEGETLEILLYSINQNHDRVYVGEIRSCEVLMPAQVKAALKHYKKLGWFESMRDQIKKVGGDASRLNDASLLFNVRFRRTDVDLYQPPRLARRSDLVSKFSRYKLVRADRKAIIGQWQRRKGTTVPPSVQTITRSGHPGVIYDPIHAALQGQLLELLKARFGKDGVLREEDFVDISVSDGKRRILIEIKSDADARLAIRKGLGQILEYAYFHPSSRDGGVELFIVAPAPLTTEVSAYMSLLRSEFELPITYCPFSLADELPDAFG